MEAHRRVVSPQTLHDVRHTDTDRLGAPSGGGRRGKHVCRRNTLQDNCFEQATGGEAPAAGQIR